MFWKHSWNDILSSQNIKNQISMHNTNTNDPLDNNNFNRKRDTMKPRLELEKVTHTFPPFYNKDSEILILGSMPSRKSRELAFYYMHPQNKFWKVLSKVFEEEFPDTIEKKKEFLTKYKIALWDCIESCEIQGSSDASIKNVQPTNLNEILMSSKIKKIYTTGKKAQDLYNKYHYEKTKIEAIQLPSTSPANIANFTEEQLLEHYQILKK